MRLGIDLDGVVADFTGGWIRLYNDEFGTDLTRDQVVRWHGVLDITHFASKQEFWRWARRGDGPSLFATLDPYEGALARLHDLATEHEVVIITTKPRWARSDTFRWLADHELPSGEIHITERKYRVGCDVYLDDSPLVVPELVARRPEATVCRFVRPWNRPVAGAVDIDGWSTFHRLVTERSRTS